MKDRIGQCFRKTLDTPAAFQVLGPITSFMSGGCLIAARAFQRVYGGELLAVASTRNEVEHVVVRKGAMFYDCDGAQTKAQLLRKMRQIEGVPSPRIAPFRSTNEIRANARQVRAIEALLRRGCPL